MVAAPLFYMITRRTPALGKSESLRHGNITFPACAIQVTTTAINRLWCDVLPIAINETTGERRS
jgi:hypothetical protein